MFEVLAPFLLKIEVFWDTRSDAGVIFLDVTEDRRLFYAATIFMWSVEGLNCNFSRRQLRRYTPVTSFS
jgi:hypothetical protein